MVDILRTLAVEVHCDQCGDFEIGADVIAESQRMLAEGCLGSPQRIGHAIWENGVRGGRGRQGGNLGAAS